MPMNSNNGRRKIHKCVLTQSPCQFLLTEPSWGIPTLQRSWRYGIVKPPAVCACAGHWLHWSSEHLSPCQGWCKHVISTWQSLWCKCCYEVMGWDLGINHPAQQQAEDWEGILCEPWSSPCTSSQLCTGRLYFPLLGAEGNVFGGLGNDYWPTHLGNFSS